MNETQNQVIPSSVNITRTPEEGKEAKTITFTPQGYSRGARGVNKVKYLGVELTSEVLQDFIAWAGEKYVASILQTQFALFCQGAHQDWSDEVKGKNDKGEEEVIGYINTDWDKIVEQIQNLTASGDKLNVLNAQLSSITKELENFSASLKTENNPTEKMRIVTEEITPRLDKMSEVNLAIASRKEEFAARRKGKSKNDNEVTAEVAAE